MREDVQCRHPVSLDADIARLPCLAYPVVSVDRWGTTDDLATSSLHSSRLSAFLMAAPSVNSGMLSSHLVAKQISDICRGLSGDIASRTTNRQPTPKQLASLYNFVPGTICENIKIARWMVLGSLQC